MNPVVNALTNVFVNPWLSMGWAVVSPAWRRAWGKAAKELKFEQQGLTLTGEPDSQLQMIVDTIVLSTPMNSKWTRIRLTGPAIPDGVIIGSRIFLGEQNFQRRDVHVGDDRAAAALVIQGDEAQALAVLGSRARGTFIKGADVNRWSLVQGTLTYLKRGVLDSGNLQRSVERCRKFARLIRLDHPVVDERLASNAMGDPEPGVRLRNLEMLALRRDGNPRAKMLGERAAKRACKSDDENLRLAGAVMVGDGVALTDLATNGSSDLVQGSAIDALVLHLGGDPRAAQALASMATRQASLGEIAACSLAAGLARLQIPGTEEALIGILDHQSDKAKAAACRALGEVGTRYAMDILKTRIGRRFKGEVDRVAKAAVRAIVARGADEDDDFYEESA